MEKASPDKGQRAKGPSIFLCLSGGGLRAALFHYGCLKRLHEVGLLGHVYAISATSGGAITAAMLAYHRGRDDTEHNTHSYEWDKFESAILETATRGLLGRTTLLVTAYISYILVPSTLAIVAWAVGWPISVFVISGLAVGLLLHLCLVIRLVLDKAYSHYPRERRFNAMRSVSARSIGRFVKMMFVPSCLRIETLNARIFGGLRMGRLYGSPQIYLNAVNLNDGQQWVFSQHTIVALTHTGCRTLWLRKRDHESNSVTIAEAVAASSAIPFFFRPVTIRNEARLLGVFVDGGVADNLALNVPKAFSVYMHSGQRVFQQDVRAYGTRSFRDATSLVLIADGSMPVTDRRKTPWTRLFSMKRITDAMANQHAAEVAICAYGFELNAGVPTSAVCLEPGLPQEGMEPWLVDALCKVRTHLDSFNLQECAALAYCGYAWVERALENWSGLLGPYASARRAPFRRFSEILPAELGTWDAQPENVERTIRYANRRLLPLRWIGRSLGI